MRDPERLVPPLDAEDGRDATVHGADPRPRSWIVRAYVLLVRIVSPRISRQHGVSIHATFNDLVCDARARGGALEVLRLLARELGQLLASAARDLVRSSSQGLLADGRFAVRMLRKRPVSTLTMAATLALGIAANATVFRVVHQVLLRPLPFPDPERLVMLWEIDNEVGANAFSLVAPASFRDWSEGTETLTLAATRNRTLTLTGLERPLSPLTTRVSPGFFELLGVEPMLGRRFLHEEKEPGGEPAVILSHELWQELGGDPTIVGSSLELDGSDHAVVGIMPAGFRSPLGGNPARLWAPLHVEDWSDRGARVLFAWGRLEPGVTVTTAAAELDALAASLAQRHPETNARRGVRIDPLQSFATAGSRTSLLLLMAAVAFVLLISCGNVATLLLARAVGRTDELSLRLAVGASHGRIVRQVMVESLLLALLGAGLGLLLTAWTGPLTARFVPDALATEFFATSSLNGAVVAFTLLAACGTALVFGSAPAWGTLRRARVVRPSARNRDAHGRDSRRVRRTLAIAEVALSLILLAGTGLMLRSLAALQGLHPGLEAEGVLTLRTAVRGPAYETGAARAAFFSAVVDAIEAMPGVESASAASRLPPSSFSEFMALAPDGRAPEATGGETGAFLRAVTPGYFESLGIPLWSGVTFDDRAWSSSEPVAIVNRTAQHRLWDGADPLGSSVRLLDGSGATLRIIGVVDDVRGAGVPPEPLPLMYVPHEQRPRDTMSIAVRTSGDPVALAVAVQDRILVIEPTVPIYNIATLAARLDDANSAVSATVQVLTWFAGLALALVLVGIHAVMSQSVTERFREFGIRIALGARSHDVLALILGEGARILLFGAAIGLIGAYVLSRFLADLIYGVHPGDPLTYVAVCAGIVAAVVLASWVPGLRALRANPADTLRA